MMKIIADINIPFLSERIPDTELIRIPATQITREIIRNADALIVRTRTKCNKELLEGSNVRLVATATIGTDHIDIPWCEDNGVIVRNAPGCNAPGVALFVWASLLRNGFDPKNSTLGVIGCGNVGGIVAQWGKRLGAEVLVCDPPRKEQCLYDHRYLPLEEVLRNSDAVTLHTPLSYEGAYPTFHIIGESAVRYLKKGVILVNAARGEVIDTKSIIDAIEKGIIKKTIIDTWEGEPNIDSRLLELADVATCHIAGYSVEGKQRASRAVLEALRDTFGIDVDLEGLAAPYKEPLILSAENIIESYDPSEMTSLLKLHPDRFESLRNSYSLHSEII